MDGVARRADSCSPSSSYMRHRVRQKWREWEHIGASGHVVNWILQHGVGVKFKNGLRPKRITSESPCRTPPSPTRLPRDGASTIRSKRSLEARLHHPLRLPHVPRPQARRQ
jgi:hypothetical protein